MTGSNGTRVHRPIFRPGALLGMEIQGFMGCNSSRGFQWFAGCNGSRRFQSFAWVAVVRVGCNGPRGLQWFASVSIVRVGCNVSPVAMVRWSQWSAWVRTGLTLIVVLSGGPFASAPLFCIRRTQIFLRGGCGCLHPQNYPTFAESYY